MTRSLTRLKVVGVRFGPRLCENYVLKINVVNLPLILIKLDRKVGNEPRKRNEI